MSAYKCEPHFHSALSSNACHSSAPILKFTFASLWILFSGGIFIGIAQSFMMEMHSSIEAGVRLESLITVTFIYFYTRNGCSLAGKLCEV